MSLKIAGLAGVMTLFMGAAVASQAVAQEPVPRGDLLLRMTQPPPATSSESIKLDDLRAVPPSPDKLSDAVRLDVRVGDPRCRPGEDIWGMDPGPQRRRPRSQH